MLRHILARWLLVSGLALTVATPAVVASTETDAYAQNKKRPRRNRRRARRAPKRTPPPPPAPAPAPEVVRPTRLRGPTRIDFDDRLIQGQTNKSGAVYLFDRKETGISSMVKRRKSFRHLTIRTVYDR